MALVACLVRAIWVRSVEGIRACRFLVLRFLRLSELRVSGLRDIGYRIEEGDWGEDVWE